jgi:hypothetical protein
VTTARLKFLGLEWIRTLASARAATALLSSFGVLWLLVEISDYFFRDSALPAFLRGQWWFFLLAGIAAAIGMCKPKTSVEHKLRGRDVTIEIAVGDIFSFVGSLVVGSNTTFDTRISQKLIAERSVQGAFTQRYYADAAQLDAEIAPNLAMIPFTDLPSPREGKVRRYPTGTVARLNPKGRTAYFVAIAHMNEHGVCEGTFEMLQVALAELWVHVGSRGSKEPLVCPVLGTGFSRLPQTRETIVCEIVRSFIAACSERVFSDRLTIVVSPSDMLRYQISLKELGSFLRHECVYADFSGAGATRLGAPA